jgi:peptidoglycan/LPS O-acetylase OafA/YrhL
VKRFAVARFARIYPACCIGLALSAPWVAAALIKHLSPAAVWAESGKAALTWSLLQAWLPQTATAWNTPAWSLSVEAFFYLCFPAIGVALWNLSRQ